MSTKPFQFPANLPFASFVNPKIAFSQSQSIPYQYGQVIASYGGDPLAGQMTPGTSIPWNQLTLSAGLIFEYYQARANAANSGGGSWQLPDDLQATLEANPGPTEMWNYSYEQWGVAPGTALITTLYTAEVGTGRGVTVIVP